MQKIFITGTSGIGKTTLANYIATKNNIPFINGSSTALWKDYNISSHRELLELGVTDPQKGLQFQYDLLRLRESLTKNVLSFVTDRSPIDNLVYFLFQNAPYLSDADVKQYIDHCNYSMKRMLNYDMSNLKLLYLTRDFMKGDEMDIITNDGKRICNDHFQNMMDGIFQQVIDKDYLKLDLDAYNYRRFREYDWQLRTDITDLFIKRQRNRIQTFMKHWL